MKVRSLPGVLLDKPSSNWYNTTMSDTDQALHALLRLQKRLIGRGSGASCCTDAKIVKISKDFKTIKDTLANLAAERDEARREVCECKCSPPKTPFFGAPQELAEVNGWDCFNKNPTGNA